MLRTSLKKTRLAPKPAFKLITACAFVVLVFVISAWALTSTKKQLDSGNLACIPSSLQPTDSSCIVLEIADTPQTRARGLSGRQSLDIDRGLLFIFDSNDMHCFWMKDMNFAIDIVWLDESKNIVHKQIGATPDSYPQNYCPPIDARYVIEVNAGVARNWQIGSVVYL